jgi:hypothetical protein
VRHLTPSNSRHLRPRGIRGPLPRNFERAGVRLRLNEATRTTPAAMLLIFLMPIYCIVETGLRPGSGAILLAMALPLYEHVCAAWHGRRAQLLCGGTRAQPCQALAVRR